MDEHRCALADSGQLAILEPRSVDTCLLSWLGYGHVAMLSTG